MIVEPPTELLECNDPERDQLVVRRSMRLRRDHAAGRSPHLEPHLHLYYDTSSDDTWQGVQLNHRYTSFWIVSKRSVSDTVVALRSVVTIWESVRMSKNCLQRTDTFEKKKSLLLKC